MTIILDLPDNVFSCIISCVKTVEKVSWLRLVCRHFNHFVCEAMFETIMVYGSSGVSSNDPVKWLTTQDGLKTSTEDCKQLMHQLNSLYTKRLPIALRRAKHLKIFVSDLFRLSSPNTKTLYLVERASWQKDVRGVVQHLMLTLPTIIRTLGNLEETTLYLSSHEPDDFTRNVSKALLTLPQLSTLNINFLEQKVTRVLPIVGSQRLRTMKITWPLGEPDPIPSPGTEGTSIYLGLLGPGAQNANLKCLQLRANRGSPQRIEQYKLSVFPQLEELVLDNVPVTLSGDVAEGMTKLQSLRLGGFDCLNCDPYTEVWTSLKGSGRGLKVVDVDVVGQALVKYLGSYEGLETLVLKLGKEANDYCVKELCERSLRYHEQSLKDLHIDLYPHSDFRITWFFEYWTKWIPAFTRLETLKVTTSMNLRSEFDTGVLVKNITDLVARIPTLRKMTIRHINEEDTRFAENVFTNIVAGGAESTTLDRPLQTSCSVVVQNFRKVFCVALNRGEGVYGSLKLITSCR